MQTVRLACWCLAGALAACVPDTDLADERPGAQGGGANAAGGTGPALPPPDDGTPPAIERLAIAVEDCLRVRATASKPGDAAAVLRADADEATVVLGAAAPSIDFAVPLPAWAMGRDLAVTLRLVDAGARQVEASAEARVPAAASPPIVITEVLANPAGSEYTQEFVELRNAGPDDVDVGGLQIEDSGGSDPLPPATLGPGARALVVAAGYDENGSADPTPAAGTLVLRVEGRIGRDGLSNGGEVVRLRGADGTVLSAYGGWVDVGAAVWNGRSVQRVPDAADGCDRPKAWTTRPTAPTPGW